MSSDQSSDTLVILVVLLQKGPDHPPSSMVLWVSLNVGLESKDGACDVSRRLAVEEGSVGVWVVGEVVVCCH